MLQLINYYPALTDVCKLSDWEISPKEMSCQLCNLFFIGVDWIRKRGVVAFNVYQKLLDKVIKSTLTFVGTTLSNGLKLPSVEVVPHLSKDIAQYGIRFKEIFDRSNLLLFPTLPITAPLYWLRLMQTKFLCWQAIREDSPLRWLRMKLGYLLKIGDGDAKKIEYLVNKREVYSSISKNCLTYYSIPYNWGIFCNHSNCQ